MKLLMESGSDPAATQPLGKGKQLVTAEEYANSHRLPNYLKAKQLMSESNNKEWPKCQLCKKVVPLVHQCTECMDVRGCVETCMVQATLKFLGESKPRLICPGCREVLQKRKEESVANLSK